MKKIFLSLLAVGFSVSIGCAQTGSSVETGTTEEQEVVKERMVSGDKVGRTEVELASLPIVVREAYQEAAPAELELVAVYKLATEIGTEPVIYEFELVEKSGEKTAAVFEGVEIEKVSDRQPDLVLAINEDGEVVEEQATEEMER